ncbi:MAG TPA: polysaccharide deacetylase family protein [Euzebya sp.]|nr:polysaccharide deacetylase family protein [Euzebya sp.]
MSPVLRPVARSAADMLLRSPPVQRAALRMGAARQRAIVLVWHRIAPEGPQPHEVVPTVALSSFSDQLDLLQDLGTVVPLTACDDGVSPADGRPLFALTFDDDDARHADHVLPILARRGLPATFFLSGRWLHGYGPYWWELLEDEIAAVGTAEVAGRHGLPADVSAPRIGRELTGTDAVVEMARRARHAVPPPMSQPQATALVAAGMEIGFHTIDHDMLPTLSDPALVDAVATGRDVLAAAVGFPIERFAYPHGGADSRTAAAVSRAGYRSAWTTAKRTARPGDPPMLRGRWDVGHRSLDQLHRILLRGLARPTP